MSIERCVSVAQGKGGVGKTSATANVAGMAAASGLRVLAVDLDPQGNLSRELGFEPDTGESLFNAFLTSMPLPLLKNVRENLDVVPGGEAVGDAPAVFGAREQRGAEGLDAVLETKLAAIADDYDLILIDTPPGDRILVEAALSASVAVVIPTRSDEASIDGVERVAARFVAVRKRNPNLRLAGVLLFGINSRSRRIERDVRNSLSGIVGDSAPIFHTIIRDHQAAAVDARKRGLLVHELKQASKADKTARIQALKSGEKPVDGLYAQDPSLLADNYKEFTKELLQRVGELEQEREAEGVLA